MMSDLVKLFGDAAPWMAFSVVLVLVSLIVTAFQQDREFSIWPPKFGPRPRKPSFPPDPDAQAPSAHDDWPRTPGHSKS